MTGIEFEGRQYAFREGETVLEALVRGGARINYSCRRGTCQACVLQLDASADLQSLEQAVLPRARLDAGTFLACQTKAAPLSVRRVERNELFVQARLVERAALGENAMRVRLEPPGSFMWQPGEYVNLRHPSGALRSYAVTSVVFSDYWLELYVGYHTRGVVSSWLRDEVRVGDFIEVQGPFGDCHYDSTMVGQSLVLFGCGLGIGTTLGIAREATLRNHDAPITFYHHTQELAITYIADLLRQLESRNPRLTSLPLDAGFRLALSESPRDAPAALVNPIDLANSTVFLCGNVADVQRLHEQTRFLGLEGPRVRSLPFSAAGQSAQSAATDAR